MQITVTFPGKGESKKTVNLSNNQITALKWDQYDNVEQAKNMLKNVQAKRILDILVDKEVFTRTTKGIYKITALGRKIRGIVDNR